MDEHPFVKQIRASLNQYHTSYPEEKIYLQLDKPFYKPGEDIWFNVFLLNANTHVPTSISDVVYVELLDPKGNVASKLELVVKEGTAHGDFKILNTMPGGLYKIMAYTQWMKNFGVENVFKKEIQIQRIITPRLLLKLDFEKEAYGAGDQVNANLTVSNLKNEKLLDASVNVNIKIEGKNFLSSTLKTNKEGKAIINFKLPEFLDTTEGLLQLIIKSDDVEESISRSIPIVLNKITINFFPEGGNMFYGAQTNMAFKALNEFGKGADVSGVIVDEQGNTITDFESFHMGMGAFEFKPVLNKKYYAKIKTPVGNATLFQIPEPTQGRYVLNLLGQTDSTLHWSIQSKIKTEVHLIGHTHGIVSYAETIKIDAGKNQQIVYTKNFPAGISVFTLFDSSGVEQCERLVFANLSRGLKILLKTNKSSYQPSEKVQLEISTVDYNDNPLPAKLAISVVDDQLISFADDKQDNILSALLLSSEVKGEIQEPSFYFDSSELKSKKALDYLLMTQGWRRFSWKEIIKNNRKISFLAEKNKNVNGVLINNKGIGISGEIVLLELGGKKRLVKVKSTKDGHFVFKNIDPTIPILLVSKKPNEIVLKKENTFSVSLNDKEGTVILKEVDTQIGTATVDLTNTQTTDVTSESGLDLSLGSDVTQLSEVVVTGWGTDEKRSLSGSVVTIQDKSIESFIANPSFENSLQGRVAGVLITPQSGNPGAQTNITVRGISSLANGRNEPLYVIDGHPIGASLNQSFANGSIIGPDDIQTIEVINSPEATALYGSAAANGAILITTKSRIGYYSFKTKRKPSKYSSVTISPRRYSATREFYIPEPTQKGKEERKDFRSTIYWNHTIVTDKLGKANLSFFNNDAISAFRITAEGFSGNGLIGRAEKVYNTTLPLSIDVKLPETLGFEDVLNLPVRIKNETMNTISGNLTLSLSPELTVKESTFVNVSIEPNKTQIIWFTIQPKGIEGKFPISLKFESKNYNDEIRHNIQVKPVGFPVKLSFSSKELDKLYQFKIVDAEQNSFEAELQAFPDVLSDLFTGAESILREPYGCFEQVSSSNFPNILALQFLRKSGLVNEGIEKQATKFIQNGYSKLVAYEIKGGGFEWFGHPPAHEGLTAYGLLQFYEMKKVFSGVDEKMFNRTREWLLNKRTGKGDYLQGAGKYGFSAASPQVTNAYITFVLSETGTTEILNEYNFALAEVLKSKDLYRMALLANAAYNLGKMNDYENLINIFTKSLESNRFGNLKAEHSIVRSYGNSLQIETISLWTIALLKNTSTPDLSLINSCIHYILSTRSYGQFGSTQGTTLALKALTEYASFVRSTREAGTIEIYSDNMLADKISYKKESREKLILKDFIRKSNGEQTLRVRFEGTKEPIPYSVNLKWNTKKPNSDARCQVELLTSLNESVIRLNETVRLEINLHNKTNLGLPMTVAVIGIPSGLSLMPWQLKELQEKEMYDFYEIIDGNLVLYFREIAPNGKQKIYLDLKAEIPGKFVGTASSAYLYYTNEYKHWEKGNSITIK
jgi:TonB-dependent SusC/RagA subfamily outer membrane receptor